MLFGYSTADLELRRAKDGSAQIRGAFPYDRKAVLSDGGRNGRPQKERIRSRAFRYRVEKADEDIHLLVGHSFDAPLASKATGTLALRDTDTALTFDAIIKPQIVDTIYGDTVIKQIESGLVSGLSPGFRIPPKRAVPKAEEIEDEPDDGSLDEDGLPRRGALIRNILEALLYELSIVTKPAYDLAQVQMRDWTMAAPITRAPHALNRWRP